MNDQEGQSVVLGYKPSFIYLQMQLTASSRFVQQSFILEVKTRVSVVQSQPGILMEAPSRRRVANGGLHFLL